MITVEIPDPPSGWKHEKRQPQKKEQALLYRAQFGWSKPRDASCWCHPDYKTAIFAYRARDEVAEKYEALGLPDGFAWEIVGTTYGVQWSQGQSGICNIISGHLGDTARKIISGKAYKLDEVPK